MIKPFKTDVRGNVMYQIKYNKNEQFMTHNSIHDAFLILSQNNTVYVIFPR